MEHIIRKELEKQQIESGDILLKRKNKTLKICLGILFIFAFIIFVLFLSKSGEVSFLNNQVKILNNNSINQTLFNEVVKCRLECGK